MSTIKSISQKMSLLYARHQDKENSNTTLDWREIKAHVPPILNAIMGATTIRLDDSSTGISITSGMAFRYNITVLSRDLGNGTEYYIKLPVYPIRLRHDLGIFSIGPRSPLKKRFIIVPQLYWDALVDIGSFEGNVAAIPLGNNEVVFSENPTETSVTAMLVVCDSDSFDDDDVIPMTPENEWEVQKELMKIFLPQVILDKDAEAEEEIKETR